MDIVDSVHFRSGPVVGIRPLLYRLQYYLAWSKSHEARKTQIRTCCKVSRSTDILVLDITVCFSPETYEASRNTILNATNNRDVSLLINNIGVGYSLKRDFCALTDPSLITIDILLNTNARFMASHPNHASETKKGTPSLIINIGSLAQLAMPYITI
jgi:hypothetical protein